MMMMGRSGIGLGTKVYKDGESRQHIPINVRRLIDQCHYLFPAEEDPDVAFKKIMTANGFIVVLSTSRGGPEGGGDPG